MPADVTAEIHGYSHPDATPTPWEVGLEQVEKAETFWISTVRPDSRPHVTPLIAVWHDDAIWFTTGPEEGKARNLSHNAACILTTGRSDLRDGAFAHHDADGRALVFRVRPVRGLGFRKGEKASQTTWRFPG